MYWYVINLLVNLIFVTSTVNETHTDNLTVSERIHKNSLSQTLVQPYKTHHVLGLLFTMEKHMQQVSITKISTHPLKAHLPYTPSEGSPQCTPECPAKGKYAQKPPIPIAITLQRNSLSDVTPR